jgi:hypothetical protein
VVLEARAVDALSKAVVNHAGLIEAQTLDGSKGSIRLIGDMNVGQTTVSGTLDASAPNGGDGGFIETSAARVSIDDKVKVTTLAASGETGKWLIDPTDFEIAAGSGERSASSIGAVTLSRALDSTSMTIGAETSNPGNGSGDITVNAEVKWTAQTELTLVAYRNIIFNASLNGKSVSLKYGQASASGDSADFYFNKGATIDLNVPGGTFSTQKGSAAANLKNYTIVRSLGTERTVDRSTLQGISSLSSADNYVLGADINADLTIGWNNFAGFTPLGQFNATFEGLGHGISGLVIKRPATSIVGLFGSIRAEGQVRNLGITNAFIAGDQTVGALAGSNLGTITNVHVGGAVNGTLRTGGLVGINIGTISSSYSEALVKGQFIAGGLVGGNETTGVISGSYASGIVQAGIPNDPVVPDGPGYAGGLDGFNSAKITGSYARGKTSGTVAAGGLVGGNSGAIDNSYAQGAVDGNTWVGGLVGEARAGTDIKNSYAVGAVTGIASVGGLVGKAETNTVITNVYTTSAVKGSNSTTTRGLIGEPKDGAVSNSYWNTDSIADGGTGQMTPGAGVGKTGAQLRQAAMFGGWDIDTTGGTDKIWRIYEGKSMPLLRSLLAPLVLATVRKEYSAVSQLGLDVPLVSGRSGVAATGRNVGTYLPYSSSQQGYDISNGELVITPKALTINAQIAGKIYDRATDAKATFTDNRIAGDTLMITSSSASFKDKNAGVDKLVTVSGITVTGTDAENYAYQTDLSALGTITPLNLVYIIGGINKVYDGKTDTAVLISGNQIAGDDVLVGYAGHFIDKNVGVAKAVTVTNVYIEGKDAPNYTHQPQQLSTTASITQRALGITATAADKVYDGTITALPTLQDNRVAGDKLLTTAVASFDDKNAGAGKKVTVSGIAVAGADAGNYLYKPEVLSTIASISTRPLDITATAADKVYDGTITALPTLQDNRVAGDKLLTNAVASFDDRNAGAGKKVTVSGIAVAGADAGNYLYKPQPLTTTASITQRPLDITATAADKIYDGTIAALLILADNRIASDALITNAIANFDDKNAGVGKKVTVSGISIAGADAANYLYKPQVMTTTASITPRPIGITATAADKAYDGTTQTSATLADNRLAGDAVTASYQHAEFVDKNGGQKKTVTVSGIALGGLDAPNYQADTSTTTSASIKPIGLTIAANADTRLADGVRYQGGNGVTYAGFIPGETAAVLAGQLRYGGDAQGAMTEGVYRITPGGLTSLNYASTFVDGALTIQPLPLGAGLIAAYTEPPIPSPLAYVGRNTGASTLRVIECGMRQPENLLLGGCLPASQPGSPRR